MGGEKSLPVIPSFRRQRLLLLILHDSGGKR